MYKYSKQAEKISHENMGKAEEVPCKIMFGKIFIKNQKKLCG
jgi:hypothetical protein